MNNLKSKLNLSILISGFIILLIIQSCNNNRIYHESITIENYRWSKNQSIIFEPEIKAENTKKPLKIYLSIRYIQGFPYKNLNLKISISNPKNEIRYKELSIPVISDDLKYNGSGAGDYWDLDYAIDDSIVFDMAGKYKIEFLSQMEEEPVNFMNEIALNIENQTSNINANE